MFGVGLTVSGMRRAAKVSGFLSATATSFDPSLMLVMGGAMAVAVPGFAVAAKKPKPACERKFSIPTNKTVDKKLITGGLLFGAGLGARGLVSRAGHRQRRRRGPRRRSWRGSAPSPSACGDNTGSSSDSARRDDGERRARGTTLGASGLYFSMGDINTT